MMRGNDKNDILTLVSTFCLQQRTLSRCVGFLVTSGRNSLHKGEAFQSWLVGMPVIYM